MFKKILVAYDESPESGRALLTGIHLAKSLNAELRAVMVQENLPPYAGYIDAEVPGGTRLLRPQASEYYGNLQADAQQTARQEGVILTTELVEGDEVQAIMECVQRNESDLLVLGLHRHSFLFSRLWNHTTDDLVQRVSSSVLGFIEMNFESDIIIEFERRTRMTAKQTDWVIFIEELHILRLPIGHRLSNGCVSCMMQEN